MAFTEYGLPSTKKLVTEEAQEVPVEVPGVGQVKPVGIGVVPRQPSQGPEAYTGTTERAAPRPTDIAQSYQGLSPEEAYRAASSMYGAPVLASGGGYKAETAGVAGGFGEAERMQQDATNRLLAAQQRYQQEAAPLAAQQGVKLKAAEVAEEARGKRLGDIGKEQTALAEEMRGKVENFRVDPERLFGQGGQRAMTQFALGIQNILSNVGEAMQGKAGTNAVLGFVRDRIAQDIGLQENDYRRMLQGYEVRRNGLMDAVQMIGNERTAAEALARQQALTYANQLDQLAARVGLTDAKFAYPLHEAAAKMKMQVAAHEQQAKQFDVGQINEAKRVAATTAASASATNAQILSTRQNAMAAAAQAMTSVPQEDRNVIQGILKTAQEKNLGAQYDLLVKAKELAKDPQIAEAMTSFSRDLVKQLKGTKDSGAIEAAVARMVAQEGMTPAQRAAADLFREFSATKMVGRGGKSLTATEAFLYDPFINIGNKADVNRVVDQQFDLLQSEKQQLFNQGGFGTASPSAKALAASLSAFVPSDRATKGAPDLPAQTSEVAK